MQKRTRLALPGLPQSLAVSLQDGSTPWLLAGGRSVWWEGRGE